MTGAVTLFEFIETFWPIINFIVFIFFGIVSILLVVLQLPGIWLLVGIAFALQAYSICIYDQNPWSWYTIYASVFIALISETFEFISGTIGLKKIGLSKNTVYGTILGAFIGSIIGTLIIPIPIFGTLAGITAGTFCVIFTFETYLNKSINLKKYFYPHLLSMKKQYLL